MQQARPRTGRACRVSSPQAARSVVGGLARAGGLRCASRSLGLSSGDFLTLGAGLLAAGLRLGGVDIGLVATSGGALGGLLSRAAALGVRLSGGHGLLLGRERSALVPVLAASDDHTRTREGDQQSKLTLMSESLGFLSMPIVLRASRFLPSET